MTKALIRFAALGLGVGIVHAAPLQITYTKLPDKKLDQALTEARADAGVPAGVTVTVSQDIDADNPGALATIQCMPPDSGGGPCQWVVTIHNPNVRTSVPRNSSNDFAVGYITFLLMHEMNHKAIKEAPVTPPSTGGYGAGGPGADERPTYACSHIAIEYGAALRACGSIESLTNQINNPNTPPEVKNKLREKRAGSCAAYRNARVKLNTGEGAEAAQQCKCRPAPYLPPANCPDVVFPQFPQGSSGCNDQGENPSSPQDNGTGFPTMEVLPPCPGCE